MTKIDLSKITDSEILEETSRRGYISQRRELNIDKHIRELELKIKLVSREWNKEMEHI